MTYVLNLSNIVKGGALQAACSFVEYVNKQEPSQFYFILHQAVKKELDMLNIKIEDGKMYIIDSSPANDWKYRKLIKQRIDDISPTIVFTFFGPAYIKIKQYHLCGVANGWVTHSNRYVYSKLNFPVGILLSLIGFFYKAYWYRRADYWVVEANCAKVGLTGRLKIPADKISIISNTCSNLYKRYYDRISLFPNNKHKITILCFSASYVHKNLEIIPYVLAELKKLMPERHIEFVLTLPNDPLLEKIFSLAKKFNVEKNISNRGPVALIDGPALYRECDILFLPTLLETFSSTYPEAMAMGLPIITTDLKFAKDQCKDAALYFNPNDYRNAAIKIKELVTNKHIWDLLVSNGKKVLSDLPNSEEKNELYLILLRKLLEERKV